MKKKMQKGGNTQLDHELNEKKADPSDALENKAKESTIQTSSTS